MAADIAQVTRLQSLDMKIAELEREVATLPKHIAQIEKTLDSHLRRLEADRAALVANQKERKQPGRRRAKWRSRKSPSCGIRCWAPRPTSNTAPSSTRSRSAKTAIRKAEDRILDLMSEAEPLDANVKKAEVALERRKAAGGGREGTRPRAHGCRSEAARTKCGPSARALVAGLKPQTYSAYERIRKKWQAVEPWPKPRMAAASACQIVLRPQFFQDLRNSAEDRCSAKAADAFCTTIRRSASSMTVAAHPSHAS